MPFGMKNTPASFQRLMNQVTAGLENSVTYINDIVVHSDTWNEHVTHMRQLFEHLHQANLVVNLKNSEFA